jgi:hypothetical protein
MDKKSDKNKKVIRMILEQENNKEGEEEKEES